jgi:hypothetical protein
VARGGTNISAEMSEHDFNTSLCLPCLIDFTELEQRLNYAKGNIISLQLSYTHPREGGGGSKPRMGRAVSRLICKLHVY